MAIDAKPQAIETFVQAGASVLVTLSETRGSTPRIQGTHMLVSKGSVLGTIGGGQLEYLAIDTARDLLAGSSKNQELSVPLGPELGQCCGGHVALSLSKMNDGLLRSLLEEQTVLNDKQPHVLVFGAGHVGRALSLALQQLPLTVLLVDNRADELAQADPSITTRHSPLPEALVREAPAGSAFVVLTHDHALDFLITREALARTDAAYVGMIGSRTKRATFASWLRSQDQPIENLEKLIMPIGASRLSDKRPAVIAAMVAAEVMEAVGTWQKGSDSPDAARIKQASAHADFNTNS